MARRGFPGVYDGQGIKIPTETQIGTDQVTLCGPSSARTLRLLQYRLGCLWGDFRAWLTPPHIVALLMLAGGLFGMTLDYAYQLYFEDVWTIGLDANIFVVMGPEFVSMAIGVLIIDWANSAAQQARQKETLLNRLRSHAASTASDALDELRELGWLYDGTLRGEDLSRANLQGADLRTTVTVIDELETSQIVRENVPPALGNADLRYARLKDAILVGANLSAAGLQSANLNGAQLEGAHLEKSILRNADCASADLRGVSLEACDMEGANLKDAIISEPLPRHDIRTKLPDGTCWSSDEDLYRFVDRSRQDFWEPPLQRQTEPQWGDEQESIFP